MNFNPPVGMSNANLQQFSNQIPQQQYVQYTNNIPQQTNNIPQQTNNIPQQIFVPPVQQQVMGGFHGIRRQMMNTYNPQQHQMA
jgi:hypothetical protein